MKDHLGWVTHHSLTPNDLRRLADALERLQHDRPQPVPWAASVAAPPEAWAGIR